MSTTDPIIQFDAWFRDAIAAEPSNPNAMTLATVSAEGRPSTRMVLLKGHDAHGFVFYTNFESRKGRELRSNAHASLCFYWKSLGRQVRIDGLAVMVSDDEADTYFASRARGSQIGAWASIQSKKLIKREDLETRYNEISLKYKNKDVPRPPHWGGYVIKPNEIEFWDNRPYRLHERLLFEKKKDKWISINLFP
mgnify:CR=1 FL=1